MLIILPTMSLDSVFHVVALEYENVSIVQNNKERN